jgi:hypothetical protein
LKKLKKLISFNAFLIFLIAQPKGKNYDLFLLFECWRVAVARLVEHWPTDHKMKGSNPAPAEFLVSKSKIVYSSQARKCISREL